MKNLTLKGMFLVLTLTAMVPNSYAQPGRFGNSPEDSLFAIRNFSLYREYFRQGNIEQALPFWRIVFTRFPRAFRSTYIDGERIMEYMYKNTTDPNLKPGYFDTLMLVFDRRIEHFGEKPAILGRKGVAFLEHRTDINHAMEGYKMLEEAMELGNMTPQVITVFKQVTVNLFAANLITSEQVIDNYLKLSEIIKKASGNDPQGHMPKVKEYVDNFFEESKAANCNTIVEIFSPRLKANPDDIELMTKVNRMLGNANCIQEPLFIETTEKLHRLNPDATTAFNLYRMFRDKQDFKKASEYLLEAISLQTDLIDKSKYLVELATMSYRDLKNHRLGRTYALKALEANPHNGHAYMVIGNIYATDKECLTDDFAKKAIFWVIVDKYVQAKTADPSLTEEANNLIAVYAPHFPDLETIFFHGFSVGDTYTFGCWINERTTVRAR